MIGIREFLDTVDPKGDLERRMREHEERIRAYSEQDVKNGQEVINER